MTICLHSSPVIIFNPLHSSILDFLQNKNSILISVTSIIHFIKSTLSLRSWIPIIGRIIIIFSIIFLSFNASRCNCNYRKPLQRIYLGWLLVVIVDFFIIAFQSVFRRKWIIMPFHKILLKRCNQRNQNNKYNGLTERLTIFPVLLGYLCTNDWQNIRK